MGLNELLSATLPEVKFNSVSEVVPSMNDIFIQVIEAKNAQS
jgi:hypothetical protein